MRRIAILVTVAIFAACGSDSNGPIDKPSDKPTDKFSGTWSGDAYFSDSTDPVHYVFSSSQTGSDVTGSVNYPAPLADTLTFTFVGASTPTTLNLEMDRQTRWADISYTYAGTYVNTDSIVGIMDVNGFSEDPLILKKNSDKIGGNFSGTWSGNDYNETADPIYFVFNASQTGSAVTGSGTISTSNTLHARDFTGTSTPPTLNFVWAAGSQTLTYTGTYITSDSIAGILDINGVDSVALSLKKN